jgi:replicative DNA helicase
MFRDDLGHKHCRSRRRGPQDRDSVWLESSKPRVTPEGIAAEIEHLAERNPISLVVVDHAQLMSTEKSTRSGYEKATEISRAMKQTALQINAPILLLSQTSRANARDHRSELEVSDLRDSGAMEEDADGIMLLFEDVDDAKAAKQSGDGTRYVKGPVKTWLKLGKNRFGEQGGFLPLLHYKGQTRFAVPGDDAARENPENQMALSSASGCER